MAIVMKVVGIDLTKLFRNFKEAESLYFTPDAGGDRYPRWPPGWVHMKGYTGLYKLVQKNF